MNLPRNYRTAAETLKEAIEPPLQRNPREPLDVELCEVEGPDVSQSFTAPIGRLVRVFNPLGRRIIFEKRHTTAGHAIPGPRTFADLAPGQDFTVGASPLESVTVAVGGARGGSLEAGQAIGAQKRLGLRRCSGKR